MSLARHAHAVERRLLYPSKLLVSSSESAEARRLFQNKFELDVVNTYQTAYPKVMAQWASHGDLDMNKQEVWEKYIDDPATYHRLRAINKAVDTNDVFQSRFTVRPAED